MHRRLKNEGTRVHGDLRAMLRTVQTSAPSEPGADVLAYRRRQIADYVKRMGPKKPGAAEPVPAEIDTSALAPRLRQTLDRLLAGDSEKQIAAKLGLSPHTIHVYVKSLYRRFKVNSRGELLARFVRRNA